MPDRWTRPKPRVMLSSRIREEHLEALKLAVEEGHKEGMNKLERYDVLEFLLNELLTKEGRKAVRKRMKEDV